MKKLCWVGPIVPDGELSKYPAQSAAANVWQTNFVKSLALNGYECSVLSYIPQPTWPRGPFWVRANSDVDLSDRIHVQYQSYCNIAGLRELWLAAAYSARLSKLFNAQFEFVFTYNPVFAHRTIAEIMKRSRLSKSWISVLADDYVMGSPDTTVFLSNTYYESHNRGRKYLLEGGTTESTLPFSEPEKNNPYILFAGSKTPVTGIREFVQAYDQIEQPHYALKIYGQGSDEVINDIATRNEMIEVHSFVSSQELEQACIMATAFVNPRGNTKRTSTTFPSKILYYLKYGRPIISAENPAIGSKYTPFMVSYSEATPQSIQQALDDLRMIDAKEVASLIKPFTIENSWDNKVASLMKDLDTEYGNDIRD